MQVPLFFSPPRGHSDDEPLRFPLGERVDGLEEISRAEEQHGLTELTVNSCFSALSSLNF